MNDKKELTRSDIAIDSDMEIDCDIGQQITVYIETWFDVDKKFGIHTADDSNAWLNMYGKFNVGGDSLRIECEISREDGSEYFDYTPTESESTLIKDMIREKCAEVFGCTVEEFIADETPGMEMTM